MTTVNINSTGRVMNLFSSESYYKYAIEVLWTLRSIAMKTIERNDGNGFYWDSKHPNFWIANITNEIIGRSLIDGYTYSTILGNSWYVSKKRNDNSGFLTYEEAEFIARIANDDKLMDELYRLMDSVSRYANDTNNPSYNIYQVTKDLLEALTDRKLLFN